MAHFLGMMLVMGFFTAPDMRIYWCRDKVYSMPCLALLMLSCCFEAIHRYFHTFNRKAFPADNVDRLIIVRPIMAFFRERFGQVYTPERDNYYNFLSVAEELYSHRIHCLGTLSLSRGAPPSLKRLQGRKVQCNEMHFHRKGSTFVICWQGVRLISMVTTACNAQTEEFVHKRQVRRAGQTKLKKVLLQRPVVMASIRST